VAYRAEIEIGVKGAQKLRELRNTVEELSNKVETLDGLADAFEAPIQSIKNFNKTLAIATKNLRLAEVASVDEAEAIKQYVTALGESNAARVRQNRLIDQQIAKQTAANQVVRQASTGFSAARYGPQVPAGTGRQGDPEFASSPIEQRTQRLLQVQRDRLTLEQALLNLQERKADAVFEELRNNEALVRSANEAKLLAAEAAGQRPQSQLSLAGGRRLAKIESKERTENLAKQAVQEGKANQDAFNQRRQYADEIFRIEQEFNKRLRTQEIDSLLNQFELKERLQTRVFNKALEQDKIQGQQFEQELENRTTKRLEAAKKVNTERTRRRAAEYRLEQRRQKRIEKARLDTEAKVAARRNNALGSALIGGAFPLLFGQGIGAAGGGLIGGGLGGLAGDQFGFALSLVGTQIGKAVDSLSLLGQELNSLNPDVGKISESLGIAGTETQQYINALVAAGREQEAAAFATSELAALVGNEGVNALKEFGADTQNLANEFTRAMTIMGVAIAEIINRTGILKAIADQVGRANLFRQARESTDAAQQERFAEFDRLGYGGIEGGSGLDAAKRRAELEREIIENQRVLNTLKKEGLDIDGVTKLLTDEQAQLQNVQANTLRAQIQLEAANGSILDDNVFALKEAVIQRQNEEELQAAINEGLDIEIVGLKLKLALLKLSAERRTAEQRAAEKAAREAERAAREAKRIQDEADRAARATQALSIELQLSRFITDQNIEIAKARRDGNSELVYTLQINKELNVLAANIAKIENEKLSAQDEALKIAIAREQAAQKLNNLEQAKLDREKDIEDAVKKNLRSIQNEIDLSQARLNGTEDQVKLEQQLQAIKESTGVKDAEALEDLKTKLLLLQEQLASEKAIQEVRDIQQRTATAGAGLRAGFIGQAGQAFEQQLQQGATAERATEIALLTQEMELAELQAQSMQNAVLGIGDAFATAMTTGVSELIAGTKNAEEVFSDFLKGVGNALLQSAQQMIATYTAIGIAKAFAGLSGGTKFGDMGNFDQAVPGASGFSSPSSFNAAGLFGTRANGGPVNANEPYIVGERGPELFLPFSSGMVLSNSDTREKLEQQDAVMSDNATRDKLEQQDAVMSDNATREQLEQQDAAMRDSATRDRLEQQDAVLRSNETTRQQLIKQQNTVMRSNEATREQLIKQQNTMTTNRIREVERTSLAMMASPGPIDVRYESSVINNVEYVTADQHRQGMAQAAERGRVLTLQALQNSVKSRRKVGLA